MKVGDFVRVFQPEPKRGVPCKFHLRCSEPREFVGFQSVVLTVRDPKYHKTQTVHFDMVSITLPSRKRDKKMVHVAGEGSVIGGRRDALPCAEEKSVGSDSESEEESEPWDQAMDVDAPPVPGAGSEGEVAVDSPVPVAIVPSLGQRGEGPVVQGVGHQLPREGAAPPSGPGPAGEGDLLMEARNLRVEGQGKVHPPAMARIPPSENSLEPRVPSSSGCSSSTGPPSPFLAID